MNNITRLSLRPKIQKMYDKMEAGEKLFDLCCDHGDFGIRSLVEGKFQRCVFVDKQKRIIEKLQNRVEQYAGADFVKRCHFYWESAERLSVDFSYSSIVIAGVGAKLSMAILNHIIKQGSKDVKVFISVENDKEEFICQLRNICSTAKKIDENYLVELSK